MAWNPSGRRIRASPVTLLALAVVCPAAAAPTLELYSTYEAMGVIVDLLPSDDPDRSAGATVEVRPAGSGAFRPAHPCTRVSDTRLVTSLFWLTPGSAYDVRVTLTDPDGPPLDGAVLSAQGSTRTDSAVPAPVRSLHVAPAGSGTACSVPSPCSLAGALGQAQAGDEVVLHAGTYYEGGMTVSRSGSEPAPIVLRGAPGESAVLDGADPATFAWASIGGGVYQATVNAADPNLVTSNGERLYPYRSLADLQALRWGIPGFFASGLDLYVRLAGDADPGGQAMAVSRHVSACTVRGNFVYFFDLTFRHYGLNPFPKAIYLDGASDARIERCTFARNDVGIGIKRAAHRTLIQDCEFFDTTFDWPWDAVKAGSGLETGGAVFYSPMTGRGTVIRRNVFHDYFDGLGVGADDGGSTTAEIDVHDNLVYNAGDDGISADGAASNVRFWRNTFHDVLVGLSLAPVATGPAWALRNVIYRTGAGNNSWSGNCFKLNSGLGPSQAIVLAHNTCDAAAPATAAQSLFSPGSATLVYSRNNIWSGTGEALVNSNPAFATDLDWDALFSTGAMLARWLGASCPTLGALQVASSQELAGLAADPAFVAPASGDYRLQATSALVDRAVRLPGMNDDFLGAAPDIGAFETAAASTCDLMSGDVSFPPAPDRTPPWVYGRACPAGDGRLDSLHTPGVLPDQDLSDLASSGAGGELRLYQLDCPCSSRIALVKNPASGRVRMLYF